MASLLSSLSGIPVFGWLSHPLYPGEYPRQKSSPLHQAFSDAKAARHKSNPYLSSQRNAILADIQNIIQSDLGLWS
jgi:hypothetical protein